MLPFDPPLPTKWNLECYGDTNERLTPIHAHEGNYIVLALERVLPVTGVEVSSVIL